MLRASVKLLLKNGLLAVAVAVADADADTFVLMFDMGLRVCVRSLATGV